MSLMSQALNDLSRRDAAVPSALREKSPRGRILIGLLVVSTLLMLFIAYRNYFLPSTLSDTRVVAHAASASSGEISHSSAQDINASQRAIASAPPASGYADQASASEPSDASLLEQGRLALSQNRLLTPHSASAFYFFSEVLARDPQNEAALSGLEQIQNTYRGWLLKADAEHYQRYKSRLQYLEAQYPDLLEKTAFAEVVQSPAGPETASPSTESSSHTAPRSVVQAQPLAKSASTYTLEISKSESVGESDLLRRVDAALAQGEVAQASDLIDQFREKSRLTSVSGIEKASDVYFSRKNVSALRSLYSQSQRSSAKYYPRVRQLQIDEGDASALEYMRSIPAQQYSDNGLALLAALLQSQKIYDQSYVLYKNLLEKYRDNGQYWLGMALSADALGKGKYAVTAYRQAQKYGEFHSDVTNFIKGRIVSLSGAVAEDGSAW